MVKDDNRGAHELPMSNMTSEDAQLESTMTGCESYAIGIGSFFGGVFLVLLVFVVSGVVLRLLDFKVTIQKRIPWDSLHATTDNDGRSDFAGSSGHGYDNTPEVVIAAATPVVASATATVSADELPSRALDLTLDAIDEEEGNGTDVLRPSTQEESISKQHHQCPACGCSIVVRKRPTSNRFRPFETRKSPSSVNQGGDRISTESVSSQWTDESFRVENPDGVCRDQSVSSRSTLDSNSHGTDAPPGEIPGNAGGTVQSPPVELRGVETSASSENGEIIKCKHDSLMPPCPFDMTC